MSEQKISLNRVLELRYQSTFKEYRKWINTISVESDATQICKEYIDELTGKNKFFESNAGKFVKSLGMFCVGAGLDSALKTYEQTGVAGLAAFGGLGLSLFDTYIADGIFKGWNPGMFVEKIQSEIDG